MVVRRTAGGAAAFVSPAVLGTWALVAVISMRSSTPTSRISHSAAKVSFSHRHIRQRRDRGNCLSPIADPLDRRRALAPMLVTPTIGLQPDLGHPLGLPLVNPAQSSACHQKHRHVIDVVPVPLSPLLVGLRLRIPHQLPRLAFRLDIHHGRTLRPTHNARPPPQPTSPPPNFCSLLRTKPPPPQHLPHRTAPPDPSPSNRPVQLRIASGPPRLLGFAIYVWTSQRKSSRSKLRFRWRGPWGAML
jgi:hypothetical protein